MTQHVDTAGNSPADWRASVAQDTSSLARGGYLAFALAIGVFVVWAALFPISSAVVAQGQLVASSQNRLIQHPTGGVVRQIAARNGDRIEEGRLVVAIEPVEAVAELKRLRAKQTLLLAKKARLETGSGSDRLAGRGLDPEGFRGAIVPASTAAFDTTSSETGRVFAEQEAEMVARETQFQSEMSALRNQLENLRSERSGITLRISNQTRLNNLLTEQETRMAPLADAGYIARIRLWEVQSRKLEADSRLADLQARLGSLAAHEAEISDRIATLDSGKSAEDAKELSAILSELAALSGEIAAAEDTVGNTAIRAPVTGRLTNLVANTIGGVIGPGETIAEIVPEADPHHVEARITPADIGNIGHRQGAQIIVTALDRRLDDPLPASVSYIAADAVTDDKTGEVYIPVHLTFDRPIAELPPLQSGMTAEIYIEIEGRTFFAYVLEPLSDSFRRAFRER